MGVYGLWPLSSGYSFDYDDSFDPRINNEFATAAFRFGHSLIPDTFLSETTGNSIQVKAQWQRLKGSTQRLKGSTTKTKRLNGKGKKRLNVTG